MPAHKQPAQLRLLRGAQPSKVNQNEPIPRDTKMTPPDSLTDDQRDIFEWVVRELEFMKIAATPDRDQLAAYAVAVDQHRKSTALLARSSLLVKGAKGNLVRNPLLVVQRDAAMQLLRFAQEFGLTPSARARIDTERLTDDNDNPFAGRQSG